MPPRAHLNWTRIKEFGGLWTTAASSLMPANAAQIMSGCHPQVGGGLRAFHRVNRTAPATGLSTVVSDLAIGFGIDVRGTSTSGVAQPTLMLVTVDGTHRLQLSGSAGSYVTSEWDTAATLTGDLEITARIDPDTVPGVIVSTLDTVTFKGFELRFASNGRPELLWGDGAQILGPKTATAAPAGNSGDDYHLKVTLDVNNGAAGNTVAFSESVAGSSFSAIGSSVVTAGTTSVSMPASTSDLMIGARPDGTLRYDGYIHRVTVKSGIGGSVRFDIDFSVLPLVEGPTDINYNVAGPYFGSVTYGGDSAVVAGANPLALNDWRVWRMELDEGATSWTSSTAFAEASVSLNPPPVQPQFAAMFIGSELTGKRHNFVSLGMGETSETLSALYEFDPDAGTLTKDTSILSADWGKGPKGVVEHQNRLVIGWADIIRFTAPGDDSFDYDADPAAGFVRPNPSGLLYVNGNKHPGARIAWMLPVPPGDFIVATNDGRIYNIQGDLGDPDVRELGRWGSSFRHDPANSPNGIFFILPGSGVASLFLDGSVTNISPGLRSTIWTAKDPQVGLGQLAATERYLFCPNQHEEEGLRNGALVYDFDTQAWFTSTHEGSYQMINPRLMQSDNDYQDSGVWVISGESPNRNFGGNVFDYAFHIGTGNDNDATSSAEPRNRIWEWKSAPLRDPDGRQVEVRAVEIPTYSFSDDGYATLDVTVNGTLHEVALPAGRSTQRFLFRERGESLDITVYADSWTTDIEAPMIEEVRIGWRSGPQIRPIDDETV